MSEPVNEIEKILQDQDDLRMAYLNSYLLIVNDYDWSVIGNNGWLIKTIRKPEQAVNDLILYFEKTEEYEQCQVLLNLKNSQHFRNKNTKVPERIY